MEFESPHERIEGFAGDAKSYQDIIDDWAVPFLKRHLPQDFDLGDPVNYPRAFEALQRQGIISSCEQEETIIGQPRQVTYQFISGVTILSELIVKLNFEE